MTHDDSGVISGEFYLTHNTRPTVYIWKRSTQYLYVGVSVKLLARLGNHNVINKVEPVLTQDSIHFLFFSTYQEAADYESYLIKTKAPKYNRIGMPKNVQEEREELPQAHWYNSGRSKGRQALQEKQRLMVLRHHKDCTTSLINA